MLGGEVAWADYAALKRDFNFLESYTESAIDTWILDNFSYISKYQLDLGTLRNTKIPASEKDEIRVYRQANFGSKHQEFQGRGDTVIVRNPKTGEECGLIDRKGVGVSYKKALETKEILEELKKEGGDENIKIQTRTLSNGLMYLGEALIEAAALKATQRVFDILNAEKLYDLPFPDVEPFDQNSLQTIEGYFVIKLPFNVLAGSYGSHPAAIYARQAHIGRVWAGKVYTHTVNIKQADFFLSLCDGGTVRIRLPELVETSKLIQGGPTLMHYQMGLDIVKKYNDGDRKALEKTIEAVLEPVKERLRKADEKNLQPKKIASSREAFSKLVSLIAANPERFCRFAEVIWYVAKYDPELIEENRPKIEKVVRHFLALSTKVKDIDDSNKPMRRWGVLLLSTLPISERAEQLKIEAKRWFVEPEFLGRSAVLFTFEELRGMINYIYRYAGGWMKVEIDSLLMDAALTSDPREREWHKLREWMKYQKEAKPAEPLKIQKEIFYYQLKNLF